MTEDAAATWCQVMTMAHLDARGAWIVAEILPGRMLKVCQANGITLGEHDLRDEPDMSWIDPVLIDHPRLLAPVLGAST